jgi:hypothetical protein
VICSSEIPQLEVTMRTFTLDIVSTMQRGSRAALALLTIGWVGLVAPDASAGPQLALDLDYAAGLEEPDVGGGYGGALRFGYKLDLGICSITPEVGALYYSFGGVSERNMYGGIAGGRVGFLKVLEPSIFAHVGYVNLESYGKGQGNTLVDVGLALDLTILPLLDIGVHAAYSAVTVKDANVFDWGRIGAHGTLSF